MVLVTGANGFIGSRLTRLLVQQGRRVRCFVRRDSNCLNLDAEELKSGIEFAYGDLRDKDSVIRAVRGIDVVYHVAAYPHLWCPDPAKVYEINVGGASNVFWACLEEKVKKVVYTNTAAILRGGTKEKPSDEDAVLSLAQMPGHYTRSKLLAYEEAVRYAKEGLPITIVSPTIPVGDGDYNLTPPGRMILDFLNGKLPGYIDTVINYISVEDVAAGHILAEDKGCIGRRYILGAFNLTLEDVFGILSGITGRAKPAFKLPAGPLLPLGFLCDKISRITRREPFIPWEGLRLAARPFAFDSSRAVRELGLPQSDIKEAFRKAVAWFFEKGGVFK